jgi:hypothetical protein
MNVPYDFAFAEISRCDDSMKTTLAVECAVRELVERGYLEMDKPVATPRGVAIYDQLRAHRDAKMPTDVAESQRCPLI